MTFSYMYYYTSFLFIPFPTMVVQMKMAPRSSYISPQEMNCLERIKKYGLVGRGVTLGVSFVL